MSLACGVAQWCRLVVQRVVPKKSALALKDQSILMPRDDLTVDPLTRRAKNSVGAHVVWRVRCLMAQARAGVFSDTSEPTRLCVWERRDFDRVSFTQGRRLPDQVGGVGECALGALQEIEHTQRGVMPVYKRGAFTREAGADRRRVLGGLGLLRCG